MAKSHPAYAQFDDRDAPRVAQWARSNSATFALLACILTLSVILYIQHGVRMASALVQGIRTFDLNQLAMPSEDETAPAVADLHEPKYRAIGEYLARRYRVSSEMATDIVSRAYATGRETKLDPMLILAVISVESSFNPVAESSMGAKGLMQVIPRFHPEKFEPLGGVEAAFDLEANIMVGAQILKQYIRRAGDLADALRMYVGASSDANENGFSAKVMTERDRLHYVLQRHQNASRTVPPQPIIKLIASAT
jgi:soluble lytic murein transglycosylase-like protein